MSKVALSIIIPVYNEEESLPLVFSRLRFLKNLPQKHEIILVSDGSVDKSEKIIKRHSKKNKKIKLISFTRNFGQQVAIVAGLKFALGDYVGIMDADLQDPPEKLIEMYQLAQKKGLDIVYATRKKRKEHFLKKIAYKLFYKFYSLASESPVDMDSGDFGILSKRVVAEINAMPEKVKFVRGLRSWTGYSSESFPIDRPERAVGVPKYTIKKLFSLAINGITSTSTKPLRVATFFGILFSFISLFMVIIYVTAWFFGDLHQEVPGFVTTIVLMLLFSGLQLFTLGILGEYIATIFHEVKNRPTFVIKDKINIKE
jgi:polyisoprenyl-phosphate glycosyltransferase